MTINNAKKTDHVAPRDLNGESLSTQQVARSVLDSICRSATELAKAAPRPPCRIRLQYGRTSVEIEWPQEEHPQPLPQPPPPTDLHGRPGATAGETDSARYLCAPTVGTFYHSPEPGAPPYVAVGDLVSPGQPVGVLEVMKMTSTIEADIAGRVVEILVPDAHPVEYRQRLIMLAPEE